MDDIELLDKGVIDMAYDTHFLKEDVVDVTAAVIGISKKRWDAVKEDYLSHFIRIIRKKELHKDLGYSGKQFDKLGSLNELRNLVAHPNRSIISKPDSVEKLWKRITRLEDALSKLRNIEGARC